MKSWGYIIDISKYHNMEHGLEYVMFYVKKTHSTSGNLFLSPPFARQAARSVRVCETRLLSHSVCSGENSGPLFVSYKYNTSMAVTFWPFDI